MKTLDQAIQNYMRPMRALGTNSGDEERREKLIRDLQVISDKNGKLAWVVVAALIVLFLAGLWLVLFRKDLASAKVVLPPLGISVAGSVWWLKSLWSEKSATELLLRLAVDLKGDALKQIVKVLAQRALPRTPKGQA